MVLHNLSICLDDLRLDVKSALDQARVLGFRVADVSAASGPISPGELSQTGRRHLLKHLADLGLRLGSLRGPAGGAGYADAATGEQRLEVMRRVVALAAALDVGVVSTPLGTAADLADDWRASRLREVLRVLADDADRAGVVVAIETAGIEATRLNALLAEVNWPSLAACCDSGAMLLQGDDPHRVGETLPGRLGLVRARDAVGSSSEGAGHEVAHGDGRLDTARFLSTLAEAGFRGDIVLSRTAGDRRAADLQHARQVFEMHLAR